MGYNARTHARIPLFRQRHLHYYIEKSNVPKVPDDRMRKFAAIPDAEVEELRADLEQCIEVNEATYQRHKGWYDEIVGDAVLIYGDNTLPVKYLKRREMVPQKFKFGNYDYDPRKEFEQCFVASIKWCRDAIELHDGQAEREAQQAAAKQERLQKAIAFLVGHGKAIGTDFTLENAIQNANDLAYEFEVVKRVAEMNGGHTSFDGDDGCENCKGWDGTSNRCDCGNRRVYWASCDGHDFEEPCIYPEVH